MWTDVELLTNEDTTNYRFGHVSKEENGSGLYQVDTLVKISTAETVITVSVFILLSLWLHNALLSQYDLC